jgi:hypothetical protein
MDAVCFTLVAAYQWAYFTSRNRRIAASAAIAVILWLVWFYTTAAHG